MLALAVGIVVHYNAPAKVAMVEALEKNERENGKEHSILNSLKIEFDFPRTKTWGVHKLRYFVTQKCQQTQNLWTPSPLKVEVKRGKFGKSRIYEEEICCSKGKLFSSGILESTRNFPCRERAYLIIHQIGRRLVRSPLEGANFARL